MSNLRVALFSIVLLSVYASPSTAQEVTLTEFSLGRIEWGGPSVGYYQVEWASSASGPWFRSWQGLGDRIASGEKAARVPAFYRVVWTLTPESGVVRGEAIATTDEMSDAYSGHLIHHDIATGSVNIVVGAYVLSDQGDGTLTGAAGASGIVNYRTGFWAIDLVGGFLPDGQPITATYAFSPDEPDLAETRIAGEILGIGNVNVDFYSGELNSTPVKAGSVVIVVGAFTLTDNGDGTLSGTAGSMGTISYETGVWSIDLFGGVVADGELIKGSYIYTSGGTSG